MTTASHYDVAVIGAGINGAGIARDAALRGLRVVVLEQADLCSSTSAASSRLIHGGLRYLEYGEVPLVFESLRERITLRRIAPHLIRPLRITIPIYAGAKRGPLLIRLGMIAYDLLSTGKTVPRHDMLDKDKLLQAEPGLATTGLRGAARYFDAQITFAERLVLENLLAARAAGADVHSYCRVTGIEASAGRVSGVSYQDVLTGESRSVRADVVVNAAGPWVDTVLATAADAGPPLIGGSKGSHIVVGQFDGAPADAFYVEAAQDGRPIFILPWNNQYLIGTTDLRCDEPLDQVRASAAEVAYLLAETNRVFPAAGLGHADIHYAYAGVRPLPRRDDGPESAITRRHIIHRNTEIARGLISIIGGKLTTYRNLAEQTVDRLARELRRKLPACRTRDTLLPGAHGIEEARSQLLTVAGLSTPGVERILSIYGGRASALVDHAAGDPEQLRCLDSEGTVLAVEVAFAMQQEMARTLADVVYRRMMLGLDADQGRPLYAELGDLAALAAGWDERQLREQLAALSAYSDTFVI